MTPFEKGKTLHKIASEINHLLSLRMQAEDGLEPTDIPAVEAAMLARTICFFFTQDKEIGARMLKDAIMSIVGTLEMNGHKIPFDLPRPDSSENGRVFVHIPEGTSIQ